MRVGSIDMHGRLSYQTDYVRAIYGDAGEIALCFFNNAIVPLRLENGWLKVLDTPLLEFNGVVDILFGRALYASIAEFELRAWTSVVKVQAGVSGRLGVELNGSYLSCDWGTVEEYMNHKNIKRGSGYTFSSGIGYGSSGYRFRSDSDGHILIFPNGMYLPIGLDGSIGTLISPKHGKAQIVSVHVSEMDTDFVQFDLVIGVYNKLYRFDNITYTSKFVEFDGKRIKSSEIGKLLLLRG